MIISYSCIYKYMINIIINYITYNNTCTIVIYTMISMEYILIYSLIISLYYII